MNPHSLMKAPSTLRHRLRQSTREAILDAAATAFNGHGRSAARMEDIAAGAGIAVGTLYNYFRDRSALVSAVLQSRTQGLLDALDEVVADAARGITAEHFGETCTGSSRFSPGTATPTARSCSR